MSFLCDFTQFALKKPVIVSRSAILSLLQKEDLKSAEQKSKDREKSTKLCPDSVQLYKCIKCHINVLKIYSSFRKGHKGWTGGILWTDSKSGQDEGDKSGQRMIEALGSRPAQQWRWQNKIKLDWNRWKRRLPQHEDQDHG